VLHPTATWNPGKKWIFECGWMRLSQFQKITSINKVIFLPGGGSEARPGQDKIDR
jgi:hypothetical protein